VLNLGFENAAPGRVGRGAGGASAAEKKLNKSEEGMRPLVIRVPPSPSHLLAAACPMHGEFLSLRGPTQQASCCYCCCCGC